MKKIVSEINEARAEGNALRPNGNGNPSLKTQEEKAAALVVINDVPPSRRLPDREFVSKDEIVGQRMQCNNCYVQDRCTYYEQDKLCYFALTNTFENANDCANALRTVIVAQMNRVTHALYQEQLDGGVLDRNLSYEMERLNGMIYGLKNFVLPPPEEVKIEAKGPGAVSAILDALRPRSKKAASS